MENDQQRFAFDLPKGNFAIIKVLGVGGGGNNALKHMYEKGIHGVDFVVCNTDAQTLDNNPVANKVQLGLSITEGLGAGADPEVGEKAAIESIDDIKAALGQNTKMVFVTAGMGGGTGTGAAPVIAKVAKEMGILTVAIVTVPFSFEGKRRLEQARIGLEKLRNNVDSLIVINNDKLRQQFGNLGFKSGFSKADEVLTNAAKGMAEVITGYFDVNIDFRDAKSVLSNSGTALMSTGLASGENKAEEAVKKALDSPLLNDNKITGAKNVLLLIRSGQEEVTMDEIGVIMDHIQEEAGHTADIIFGVGIDEDLGDAVSVLVIATGFSKDEPKGGQKERIVHSLNQEKEETKSQDFFSSNSNLGTSQDSNREYFRLDDEEEAPKFTFGTSSQDSSEGFSFLDNEKKNDEPKNSFFEKEESSEEKPEQVSIRLAEGFGQKQNNGMDLPFFDNQSQRDSDFPGRTISKETTSTEQSSTTSITSSSSPQQVSSHPISDTVVEHKTEKTAEVKEEQPVDNIHIFEKQPEVKSIQIEQRRNKLKEFSTKFQSLDSESDFEKVPAFKRKNIKIDNGMPSRENISSFMSNDSSSMNLKENRFLNKDVD